MLTFFVSMFSVAYLPEHFIIITTILLFDTVVYITIIFQDKIFKRNEWSKNK
jgi:hypothetical protein